MISPGSSAVKDLPAVQETQVRSLPRWGRFPWRRTWHSAPLFLPGESYGQRSRWGKESEVAEVIKQQHVGAEFRTGTLFIESRLVPPLLSTGNKFRRLSSFSSTFFPSQSPSGCLILQLRRLAQPYLGLEVYCGQLAPEVSTSPPPRHPPRLCSPKSSGTTCHQSQCFYIHLCLQQEISQASILGSPLSLSLTQSPRRPYDPITCLSKVNL